VRFRMNKLCSLKPQEQQRLTAIHQQNITLFNNLAQQHFLSKIAQKEFEKIQKRKKLKRLKYFMLKYKKKLAKMKKHQKCLSHDASELQRFGFFANSLNHQTHSSLMNYTYR
jgi:mannitol-1-phosphate/altronate dehydrogenase